MSNLKIFILALALASSASSVRAQSCDPWIISIYKQLYNRQPTTAECNIRNYNNGSWSSYEQLTGLIKSYQNSRTPQAAAAGDPWIIDIYKKLYNRTPSAEELKISNYNNGSWSSYEQLTQLIRNYQSALQSSSRPAQPASGDPWIVKIYQEVYQRSPNSSELRIYNYNNGKWNSYDELKGYIIQYQNTLKSNAARRGGSVLDPRRDGLIVPGGGNVISPGGGNVVSPGGGNVVSPGGGNVVSPGGGNVVSPGGGNVVSPGGGNVVSPGGGNVVSPGGGN